MLRQEDTPSSEEQLFSFEATYGMALLTHAQLEPAQEARSRKMLRHFLDEYDLTDPEADEPCGFRWEVFDRRFHSRHSSLSNSTLGSLSAVNPHALSTLIAHQELGSSRTAAHDALHAVALALLAPGLQPSLGAEPHWALWHMHSDMDGIGKDPLQHLMLFLEKEAQFLMTDSLDL
jgi:hypothetical protein